MKFEDLPIETQEHFYAFHGSHGDLEYDSPQRTGQVKDFLRKFVTFYGMTPAEALSVVTYWYELSGRKGVRQEFISAWKQTYNGPPDLTPPPPPRVKFSEIETKTMEWFYKDLIPLNTVTLLIGEAGIGKSSLVADFVAQATTGTLPGSRGKPMRVLYIVEEEDKQVFTKPRLEFAGADLDMIDFLGTSADADEHLTFPSDLDKLESAIIEYAYELVIVDPLTYYMDDGLNENSNKDVRGVATPLMTLCNRLGVTLIGLGHFRKDGARKGYSMLGSSGWSHAVRCVLWAGMDHVHGFRYIGPEKLSIPEKISYLFQMTGDPDHEGIAVGRITDTDDRYIAEVLKTIAAIEDGVSQHEASTQNRVDATDSFRAVLSNGPQLRDAAVLAVSEATGIPVKTLNNKLTKLYKDGVLHTTPDKNDHKTRWLALGPGTTAELGIEDRHE